MDMDLNPMGMDTPTPDRPGGGGRRHLRIYGPFPAIARGVDANAEVFELRTVLDNLSARGLYMRLARRVKLGAKLFVVTRLSMASTLAVPAPCVAIRGVVLRVELQPDGTYGVAVAFRRHRFL